MKKKIDLFIFILIKFKTKSQNPTATGSNLELTTSLIEEKSKTPSTPITIKQQTSNINKSSNTPETKKRSSSFVSKHLLIQRRKTIHDIINLDILNTSILSTTSSTGGVDQTSKTLTKTPTLTYDQADISSKLVKGTLNKKINNKLNDKNILASSSTSPSASYTSSSTSIQPAAQITRELVLQGHVQLLNVIIYLNSFVLLLLCNLISNYDF